jgi:hypothetical protein
LPALAGLPKISVVSNRAKVLNSIAGSGGSFSMGPHEPSMIRNAKINIEKDVFIYFYPQ